MLTRNPKILLVDEDPKSRSMYRQWLTDAGFEVIEADASLWATAHLESDPPDCIILDLNSPAASEIDRHKRRTNLLGARPTPLIGTTSYLGASIHALIKKSWLDGALLKPFTRSELLSAIRRVISPNFLTDCDEDLERRISQMKQSAWNRLRTWGSPGESPA